MSMSIGKRYLIVKKAKTKRPKRGKNERKKMPWTVEYRPPAWKVVS